MKKEKLSKDEKRVNIAITINPVLGKKLKETHKNVSKHVEWLIYQDMRKNNIIEEMPL